MEWFTKATQADRPFGSWADDLADAFVQLEPRKISDAPFCGAITKADLAPIHISRVTATPHSVQRQSAHIARGAGDLYFLNLQLDGLSRSVQRGHEQICGPGDLAVVDTTEPFEIINLRGFTLLCFAAPRALLPGHFADRPRLTLSSTEMGRALARTLSGYADLCIHALAAPVPALGHHLLDLLSHAEKFVADAPLARAHAPVQLSMMLDHVDRHFTDARFNAATLARKFGCSVRYVHKLFGTTGRSVGEHVNNRRILASARHLLDPGCRRMTIAEIAFAAGFSDISYFNRVFKRCNGLSPREFRNGRASKT
jgi:AraC-like DNA-binding protein